MTTLEFVFALSALIIIVAFLAFALTMMVILLSEKSATTKAKNLFQTFITKLAGLRPW